MEEVLVSNICNVKENSTIEKSLEDNKDIKLSKALEDFKIINE